MVYNFYHITDVHYHSKKNFDCDWRTMPQPNTQICILKSEEAFRKALEIIEADKDTSTVIITGDITNHGDDYSLEEASKLLQEFTAKGGNPSAYTDSHDYHNTEITDESRKLPASQRPEERIRKIFNPFGRDKAFDTYDDGITFIAEILPGLYHIAMGYNSENERTLHHPYFSDELMAWVKGHIEEVNKKGGVVICSTHRPIVAPSPAYEVIGKGHTFRDGDKRLKELADMGVKLFFSGHSHVQCMKEIVSDNGNKIYSVQTSSLAAFPPKMRKITYDTDNRTINIRTIDMELPDLGMSFTEYARKGFLGIIEEIPYNMEHDVKAFANTQGGISLPKDLIMKHPKLVMFAGRKLNGLTYGKVAAFGRKYNGLTENDYADKKDEKFVELLLRLIANLYRGNAPYSPDTVEYRITMGMIKKIEKLLSLIRVDAKKLIGGYTLTEFVEPLLYNNGPDDDNLTISIG